MAQRILALSRALRKVNQLSLALFGAEPKVVKTTERIPVSELEQVKIEVITEKTTDDRQPK